MWRQAFGCFKSPAPRKDEPQGENAPGRDDYADDDPARKNDPDRKGKATEEEEKNKCVVLIFGEMEEFSKLVAECHENQRKKAKQLGKENAFFRRVVNDDDSFYKSFLFAYVEYIWRSQDMAEVERIKASLIICKWTNDARGTCPHFEELEEMFFQLLDLHIGEKRPRSRREFLERSRTQWPAALLALFLDDVASNEVARQSAEVLASPNLDHIQMYHILGQGSSMPHHMKLTALSDALGVAVRVVFLDCRWEEDVKLHPRLHHRDYMPTIQWKVPTWCRAPFPPDFMEQFYIKSVIQRAAEYHTTSSCSSVDRGDPIVTLLFRPTPEAHHYDIIYPKLR